MTSNRNIIISYEDHDRLSNLFYGNLATAFSDKPYLQALRGELDLAQVVPPEDIPHDVVTMNSTVRLRDTKSNAIDTFTLVFPHEANIAEGKLSVLAPIGTAILGYRVGDIVRWQVPSGMIHVQIEELISQPKRDGVTV